MHSPPLEKHNVGNGLSTLRDSEQYPMDTLGVIYFYA